jgi:hypothetical protein
MDNKILKQMKIEHKKYEKGARVRLLEDVDMGYCIYTKGHEFTITGSDDIRGLDLEDDEGNRLCETRFVKMELI